MNSDKTSNQKTGFKKKLDLALYSVGGIGYNMTSVITMSYLTFFCTDIFGVSSMVVAGLMFGTKLIDAVTDPIMGFIADKTRTKHGQYRPYIILGSPILAILIYLLFSSPDLSASMKVVFLYVVYISYSLAFTLVGVPFTALVPVIADDSAERAFVVSWKNIMTQIGRTFVVSFALPIVELMGGGKLGWARYGAFIGVLVMICFWTAAFGSRKYDVINMKLPKKKVSFRTEARMITKNTPLLMLIIAFGTDMIANASLNAANVYYFKYVLDRQDLVAGTSLALTLTGVLVNFALPSLIKRIDKKRLYWWGTLFSIVPLAILLINPVVPAAFLMFLMIVFGLISALPSNLAWAMLPDCVDYAEYITGEKGSAIVSSTFTFFNKLGTAFGSSMASLLLGLVGFVANQAQPENVLMMIVFLRFGMPILGYIASLISMHFYELTEEKNVEVQRTLKERRNSYLVQ